MFFLKLILFIMIKSSGSFTTNSVYNPELFKSIFSQPKQDESTTLLHIVRNIRPTPTRFFNSIPSNLNKNSTLNLSRSNDIQNSFNLNKDSKILENLNLEQIRTRKKKAHRKSFKGRKYCLNCLTDFKNKPYNLNDACLNPLINITEAELRFLNMCPDAANYCQTEVYTINGVFSGLERRCSTICVPICFQRSYGTETESCVYCCPMLEYENFDENSVAECPR